MPLGDLLFGGFSGARDALRKGDEELAAAVLGGLRSFALADEALALLRAGRRADALTCIERAIDPKWPSRSACAEAYRKAMTGKAGPYMRSPL